MQDLVCQTFHLFFSTNCSVSNSGCWLNVGINWNETLNIQCVTHLVWGNAINTFENEWVKLGKAKAWLYVCDSHSFLLLPNWWVIGSWLLVQSDRDFSCKAYGWHSSQHYITSFFLFNKLQLVTYICQHSQLATTKYVYLQLYKLLNWCEMERNGF